MIHFVKLTLFLIILKHDFQVGEAFQCRTKSKKSFENGQDKLHIHLIPHSHDDVGWLKTVDQYFYGKANYIQNACVKCILDSMLSSLWKNTKWKFIYSEIAFFWKWWNQIPRKKKDMVKTLVRDGRLQFANGGWVMNDEATAHYSSIIDHYSMGLKFIEDNFGANARPRAAWEIDPFGHSAEQASLLAQMGFDGVVFARIHVDDKRKRRRGKTLETIWQGDSRLKGKTRIFTSILYDHYTAPDDFCFDSTCSAPDLRDDGSWIRTVDYRISQFIKTARNQAASFKTNHLLVPMGTDFAYMDAEKWFRNMDELIRATQKNTKVKIFYSTPWEYFQAVNKKNVTWSLKTDDFFPYADGGYWTGFFSSRPNFKRYVRYSESLLQACKQVETLHPSQKTNQSSWSLQDAVAITQHHDAISGTSRQNVIDDYKSRLTNGNKDCLSLMGSLLHDGTTRLFCHPFDQSQYNCKADPKLGTRSELTIYNPMSQPVERNIVFAVVQGNLVLKDSIGNLIKKQQITSMQTVESSSSDSQIFSKHPTNFLHFKADLPPLGYVKYRISSEERSNESKEKFVKESEAIANWDKETDDIVVIGNEYLQLVFSKHDGELKEYKHVKSGKKISFVQDYLTYADSGGAYLFEPESDAKSVRSKKIIKLQLLSNGLHVKEVRQVFSPRVSQVIRLYSTSDLLEIDYVIGPLPSGTSFVTRFETNLKTEGTFYTDANGRQIIKRKRNYYPTFKFDESKRITGNYYPITTSLFIQDRKKDARLTVYTDRSYGGTSLTDGSLELMLHRRLIGDDGKGLGEALNGVDKEGKGVMSRGKLRLFLSDQVEASKREKIIADQIFRDPILLWTHKDKVKDAVHSRFSALSATLPPSIQLLTVERVSKNKIMIRLEHLGIEGPSEPVSFSIKSIFRNLKVLSAIEMGLGGNVNYHDIRRLKWETNSNRSLPKDQEIARPAFDTKKTFNIILKPSEIRTFVMSHM